MKKSKRTEIFTVPTPFGALADQTLWNKIAGHTAGRQIIPWRRKAILQGSNGVIWHIIGPCALIYREISSLAGAFQWGFFPTIHWYLSKYLGYSPSTYSFPMACMLCTPKYPRFVDNNLYSLILRSFDSFVPCLPFLFISPLIWFFRSHHRSFLAPLLEAMLCRQFSTEMSWRSQKMNRLIFAGVYMAPARTEPPSNVAGFIARYSRFLDVRRYQEMHWQGDAMTFWDASGGEREKFCLLGVTDGTTRTVRAPLSFVAQALRWIHFLFIVRKRFIIKDACISSCLDTWGRQLPNSASWKFIGWSVLAYCFVVRGLSR